MGRGRNNLMYGDQLMVGTRASLFQQAEEEENIFLVLMNKDWRQALAFKKEHKIQLNENQVNDFQIAQIKQDIEDFRKIDIKSDYLDTLGSELFFQKLYNFQIASKAPLGKSVFASLLEKENNNTKDSNNNLTDNFLSVLKYQIASILHYEARGTGGWVPPNYSFCSEQEKHVDWEAELEYLLTKRLPLDVRQQIENPVEELSKNLEEIVALSVEQQVVQQVQEQINFDDSKYSFAFSKKPFDEIVHKNHRNVGSRFMRMSSCSTMDFASLSKKTALNEKTSFCPKCCNEHDFSKMSREEIEEFIEQSEIKRRERVISYRLDTVIKQQFKEHNLLYKTPEQIKKSLLNKNSGLAKEIRSGLKIYTGLLPKDIRKQGRKLKINIWGQEIV